jgi:hypothetical protein
MRNDNKLYKNLLKKYPKNLNSGLTIIDKIKNEYYILIGYNIKNNIKEYSLFGGHYEIDDKTSLHTAIREFLEEFFNIKINNDKIDIIVKELLLNNLIFDYNIKISNTSISYFGNFNTLNLIYKLLYIFHFNVNHSKTKPFNIYKFFKIRNNLEFKKKSKGLNEIEKINIKNINYFINNNKINIKKFTKFIINKIIEKLFIN